MWTTFKLQIPAIIATVALVFGAVAYTTHQVIVRQDAALVPLQRQNEMLRAQTDENRRELEATTQLLKEAMARPASGGLFADATENPQARQEQIAQLADDLSRQIKPALAPAPKSPAEVARMEDEQVNRVADRLTHNLQPVLAQAAQEKAASEQEAREAQAQAAQLRTQLAQTQAAAQDALKLTHEVSALYYDSFKDQGVLVRLMSLPAELVIDTAKGNLVTSRDRAKAQKEISAKINELDARLNQISAVPSTTRS